MIKQKRFKNVLFAFVGAAVMGTGALLQTGAAFAATAATGVTATYNAATSSIDVDGTMGDTINDNDLYFQIRVSGTDTWEGAAMGTPPVMPSGATPTFPYEITGIQTDQLGNAAALIPGTSYDVQVLEFGSDNSSAAVEVDSIEFDPEQAGLTFASQPTGLQATVNGNSVSASWGAPTTAGSSPITGYLVQITKDGTTVKSETTANLSSILSSVPAGDYNLQVAAIDGSDGPSPNRASVLVSVTSTDSNSPGNGSSVSGGTGAKTPTASDDGFSLGLANPFVVITAGIAAAAALLVFARLQVTKR